MRAGADGDLLFAATLSAVADLGGGRLVPPESGACIDTDGSSIALGRYRSTGEHVWSRLLGESQPSAASLFATSPADDIALVGRFWGGIEIDGTLLRGPPHDPPDGWCLAADTFVASFRGADGSLVWARPLAGALVGGIAVDSMGDVVITGTYETGVPVDIGGGPAPEDGGLGGLFVTKLAAADGAPLWSRAFPGSASTSLVVVDEHDDVLLTGAIRDALDLGGGLLPDGGEGTMFAAKLSGADGSHVWSDTFFGSASGSLSPVAATALPGGDLLVTGRARYGRRTVRLSGADGVHVWSRPVGGSSLASSSGGLSVALTGGFTGVVSCGGTILTGPTEGREHDVFVAWLRASDGAERWCESFAGYGYQYGNSITVDGADEVSVIGSFRGTMGAGPFELDAEMGNEAMYLAHLVAGPDTGSAHLTDGGFPFDPTPDAGPPPDAAGLPPPAARTCPPDVRGAPDPVATCRSPAPPARRRCGGSSSCGDGVLTAGWCPPEQDEECDGSDLGGRTCESLGYASGTLRCGSDCAFDTSHCDSCPLDDRIAACTTTALDDSAPIVLDMVATPDEIGVAWVSGSTDPLGVGLYFARLDHSLARLSQSGCLARFTAGNYPFVSLARTSRGWLLAASGGFPGSSPGDWLGMIVVPLDPTGSPSGPSRTVLPAIEPRLVGSEGGPPLLLWQDSDFPGAMHAALLCDDGSEVWRVDAFDSVASPTFTRTAAFTGDGFLVGARGVGSVFYLRRLALDGSLSPPTSIPGSVQGAQLAWDGAEGRLVYSRGGAGPDGIVWRRLSHDGEPIGDEAVLARPPLYTDTSIALRGRDTVIALAGGDSLVRSSTRLDVMRVGADGEVLVPPFAIRRDPVTTSSYRVVTSGDDVFLGWTSSTSPSTSDWRRWRIGILRLAP